MCTIGVVNEIFSHRLSLLLLYMCVFRISKSHQLNIRVCGGLSSVQPGSLHLPRGNVIMHSLRYLVNDY